MIGNPPLPPVLRRAPALAAGLLTAFTVSFAHLAFSSGPVRGWGLALALGVALAGLLLSEALTGGWEYLSRSSLLEVVGSAWLVLGLFLALAVQYLQRLPGGVEAWELVVLAVAVMTFFLRSQRSFLLLLSVDSFLTLGALLHRPSSWAAAFFSALLVVLLSVLAHREKLEEARAPGPALDPWVPLRPLPVALAGLFLVLGLFLALKTGGGKPLQDLFESAPGGAGRRTLSGRLHREMSEEVLEDPFGIGSDPSAPGPAPGGRPGTPRLTFERDLRFGDRPEGSETVLLYVQLRDRSGAATEGEGLPLYFLTGVVSRYDGRTWSADPAAKTVRTGGGGPVTFGLDAAPASLYLEQRIILAPLPAGSLFALYPVKSISLDRVLVDGEGILSRPAAEEGRFRYSVSSLLAVPSPADLGSAVPGRSDPHFLEVPAGFRADPAAREILEALKSRAATPHARIQAALSVLAEFKYTLTPGFGGNSDPTLEFLRRRQGFSQHFASALALLLRELGLPARIGIGVSKGERSDQEPVYIFRRKHVHCWTEAYFEGLGWIPFDPSARSIEAMLAAPQLEPAPPLSEDPKPEAQPPAPAPTFKPEFAGGYRSGAENLEPQPAAPSAAPRLALPFIAFERGPQENEFQDLWDAIDSRAAGAGSGAQGFEALRRGAAGRGGSFGEAVRTAGGAMWSFLRDMLIVFAAGAVLYFIVARLLKRRRRPDAGEAELVEGHFLDQEEPGRADLRSLRESVPKGTCRRRIAELYLDLLARFSRAGLEREASQTPREYQAWLGERLAPAPPWLVTLTDLFHDARYGAGEMSAESLQVAESAYREAVREVRRRR